MASQAVTTGMVTAGQEMVFVNVGTDAPTIFCDGFKGMTVQSHVTKISFFEQIANPLEPGVLNARFVLNLTIPNDQFLAISKLFKDIVDGLPPEVMATMQVPTGIQQ